MNTGNNANLASPPCRRAFTSTILELGRLDRDIVVLTTDARGSVSLEEFAGSLPAQFVEVGIAEQNMVGIGAGLASCGKKAFACGPACFLSTRSFEQAKVDAAYARTNVKLIGVSGGVSYGALGATHHSLQDIAAMRAIPGMTVILPCDYAQTVAMTRALAAFCGPVYVRMGRNAVPDVYAPGGAPFVIGRANALMRGSDIAIIASGETVWHALQAGKLLLERGIRAMVLDMHTIKPLDAEAVLAAADTGAIITVEEHSVRGGLGAAVAELVSQRKPTLMRILGIPDEPAVAGTSHEVFRHYGLTGEGIFNTALKVLDEKGKR